MDSYLYLYLYLYLQVSSILDDMAVQYSTGMLPTYGYERCDIHTFFYKNYDGAYQLNPAHPCQFIPQ